MLYREELNRIREAVNKIEGPQAEDQELREEAVGKSQEDQGSHEGKANQTDTARDRDREEYTVAFMHGVKCLAEDLAAALPAGSGREALKSILKTNYDYTDQDIERLFS